MMKLIFKLMSRSHYSPIDIVTHNIDHKLPGAIKTHLLSFI